MMVNKQVVNRLLDNLHTYMRQLEQADDLDLVFNIFQKHLGDFEQFTREIRSWLDDN